MKKMLKIMGIVLLVIVVLAIVLLKVIAKAPSPSADYREKLETGGEIEAKYLESGSCETSYYEEGALQNFEKYEIWYPSDLKKENKKYPVIVVNNGTGWKASRSKYIYEHYASWGFIVVGNEESHSWNAFGAEMAIRHLERMNENQTIDGKENIFYQKIDFDNVGVIGHSQGGVGVFNAVTNTKHQGIYKTAIALSPTGKELAEGLEWSYDATKINIPILLVSGGGGGDDWVVTLEGLNDIYGDIHAPKVMMRRKNTPHGATQYSEDGYVVAWFMWHLQGDEEAAKAFLGDNPEIMNNDLYENQNMDL